MNKKFALLIASIMTFTMVPITAFASTKLTAVDEIHAGIGEEHDFISRVELSKNDDQVDVDVDGDTFEVYAILENGKYIDGFGENNYTDIKDVGIEAVERISDTKVKITITEDDFNGNAACVFNIKAYAIEEGDVVVKFISNVPNFKTASEVIAYASKGEVEIESEGVKTFVEDGEDTLEIKDISIKELRSDVIKDDSQISLKLSGNWKFEKNESGGYCEPVFLNNTGSASINSKSDEDEIIIDIIDADDRKLEDITLTGITLKTTKKCDVDDIAYITVKSKEFDSAKLEVAKMVAEAVTYTVEDEELPTIWAGKDYKNEDYNTLELHIEENTGDILNTSRKATFTFPEGIEVYDNPITENIVEGVKIDGADDVEIEVDENVVTIKNYWKEKNGKNEESNETDMDVKFIINAAPTFNDDVKVKLGGEFDNVELKVATVKAPYIVEAKTSEVRIDYRYVPVNEIVIKEAEEGLLEENDVITLQVEKMDFEDAGKFEVTEGDIDVDLDIEKVDKSGVLEITVKDESTEASTIVISGLELYLDRTLPVGGYAINNIMTEDGTNILWENSRKEKTDKDYYYAFLGYDENGLFKYKEVTINDKYVEVVTQARDQDDYTTNRKIIITVGAGTMAVGTETITLDTPAYINNENYTELPLRAVSEAFGAKVNWDDSSRTVTIMMGQRVVSMTIGSKTMYINGTPVLMNTAPEITNERTFIPVRDLANALGIAKIDWNELAQTVTLN